MPPRPNTISNKEDEHIARDNNKKRYNQLAPKQIQQKRRNFNEEETEDTQEEQEEKTDPA